MKRKQTVTFSGNGLTADLELCVFCKKMIDLHAPGSCEHFEDDYEGTACTAFEKVDDVPARLMEALKVRSQKHGNN